KYWLDTTFFEGVIPQTAWDELEGRDNVRIVCPPGHTARALYNLACGRAIMCPETHEAERERGVWLQADPSRKDASGRIRISRLEGLPVKELERQLLMLPIPNYLYYPIRNALMDGEAVAFKTDAGSTMRAVANAELRSLA